MVCTEPSDCRKIKRPSENHTAFCCRTTASNAIGHHYIAALTVSPHGLSDGLPFLSEELSGDFLALFDAVDARFVAGFAFGMMRGMFLARGRALFAGFDANFG